VTGYLFPLSLIVFLYSVMLYRLLRNVGYLQIYNKKSYLKIASSKAAAFNMNICFSGSHRACEQRDHEGG
jgi:hypothetical protein